MPKAIQFEIDNQIGPDARFGGQPNFLDQWKTATAHTLEMLNSEVVVVRKSCN